MSRTHGAWVAAWAIIAVVLAGCSEGGPGANAQRKQLEQIDPNPQVDASAASEYITVEETTSEGVVPMTLLKVKCTVLQEGALVAEWPSTGGTTESRDVVVQDDGSGTTTLMIPEVRCTKGQKVILKPKS